MQLLDKQLFVSAQITANDFAALADAGIKTIINNRPDHEEPNQLIHTEAQQLAEQHGIAYHYLPMANGQPMPETLVADFQNIIKQSSEPVLAHCRSGMRSSIIWALGEVSAGDISPQQAIEKAAAAGIKLENYLPVFESLYPN